MAERIGAVDIQFPAAEGDIAADVGRPRESKGSVPAFTKDRFLPVISPRRWNSPKCS